MTTPPPPGGLVLDPAELDARWAHAWHPEEVARRLDGVRAPWCVAAGWALDLFRGGPPRPHGDLEIAVPAGEFAQIRERFPEYAFDAAGSGRVWREPGPEVLAYTHQTWLREPASGRYLLDVFREPHDGGTWICRRDERLRLPYERIVERTADGIPYLAPELVLLFKAKARRPKDRADFDAVLPLLGPDRRASLAGWLDLVHPGHVWLDRLGPVLSVSSDQRAALGCVHRKAEEGATAVGAPPSRQAGGHWRPTTTRRGACPGVARPGVIGKTGPEVTPWT